MNEKTVLKRCPFCDGEATILVSDDEGNARDEDYEKNPWSGLSFKIGHTHESNKGCPIAQYGVDGGSVGVYLYDSREEAIETWNTRYY